MTKSDKKNVFVIPVAGIFHLKTKEKNQFKSSIIVGSNQ